MRVGKITRLKLVVTVRNISFNFKLGFQGAKKVLSLPMKLLLLFYQIRYSRENNRNSFVFQKCKTTNGKPDIEPE